MPTIDLGDYGDLLFDAGIPGMDADINISSIVNYVNKNSLTDIGIAVGVDAEGTLSVPAAGNVVGVVMRHPVFTADASGNEQYPPYSAVPVMEFGRVWAICVAGCNVGDAVSTAPDGTLSVGGAIPIDGAFWDDKAAAGGIARVRLNRLKLPAAAVTQTPGEDAQAGRLGGSRTAPGREKPGHELPEPGRPGPIVPEPGRPGQELPDPGKPARPGQPGHDLPEREKPGHELPDEKPINKPGRDKS